MDRRTDGQTNRWMSKRTGRQAVNRLGAHRLWSDGAGRQMGAGLNAPAYPKLGLAERKGSDSDKHSSLLHHGSTA
jgi:hypothetical protein